MLKDEGKMKHSYGTGFSFGLTSGIITTLGLMVGLHSSTQSKIAVVGGILTIAVADAFSDALGIHVSEESQTEHSTKEIWEATLATFFAKFAFVLTFIVPILFFDLFQAILVSIVWGLTILSIFSFVTAKKQKKDPWKMVAEHLVIGLLVILTTHFVGDWMAAFFEKFF